MAGGDVYRLAHIGRVGEVDWVNVHHYQVNQFSTTTAEDCASLCSAFAEHLQAQWEANMFTGVVADLISVRSVTQPGWGSDLPIAWQGDITGSELLPFQTSPEIVWRTARFGRRYRGRTFLPPITEGEQTNGAISAGRMAGLALLVAEYYTISPSATPSKVFGKVIYSEIAGEATPVTTGQVMQILRTQRRRRSGASG